MNKLILIPLIFASYTSLYAQQTIKKIDLFEAIEIAKEKSIEAMEAKNSIQISYWQYRGYKADLLPNIDLQGVLPSVNRSYNRYQNADGSYSFVSSQSMTKSLSLSINQNIPFTGGVISLQSELEQLDQFGDMKNSNYLSVPASITFRQPIFAYNSLKWDMKTEPIRNIESQKQHIVDIETICINAIQHYFNLLLSKTNLDIAKQNKKNSEQLYKIAQSKREMGLISQSELQQLRLNFINSSADIIESEQSYEQNMYSLRTFLGFDNRVEIIPEIPKEAPFISITYDNVLNIAKRNNPFTDEVSRRLIESDKIIAQARSQRGPKVDVYLSVGFSGNDKILTNAYKNLQDRQVLSLGINVPILDWGRGKGKVIIAKYQKEMESGRVKQDIQNFEQEIKILVNKIQTQNSLVEMYQLADSIAQNRYKIAHENFMMGNISVLDINAAQIEEDNAKRTFINQKYFSWLYYYKLRQVTLHDFTERRDLIDNIKRTQWTERYLNKLLNNDEIGR